MSNELASVIIPNWNGATLLPIALDSLRGQRYPSLEIIVVDGGSHDGSQKLVRSEYPEVKLVALGKNRGFAGNVNRGLMAAHGRWLIVYNNDAEAAPDFIAEVVGALEENALAGAAAPKVLEFDRRDHIACAGDSLRRDGIAVQRGNGRCDNGDYDQPALIFGASGCAAAYRREMLEDVGLLDESFVSYLEDVDLALRAQWRAWQCVYVPSARVYHKVSATGGGRIASYYVARNTFRLVAKSFPDCVLRKQWRSIINAQLCRFREAAAAWRGEAARATMQGIIAGAIALPAQLGARRRIMAARRVPEETIAALLVG